MPKRTLAWIAAIATALGAAPLVRGDEPGSSPFQREFTSFEQEHWAFQPVVRPEVPEVANRDWVRTPIDAFLLARLEKAGIEPAPPAERATLLRRVYLDLIGLPPTPDEQRAFLDDAAPGAYERVVDGLLARPEYGERWARHWLDVVRYAESNGYERDGAKPQAWRYRDYVVHSLNDDKPYDRFLIEQLAGDEVEATNAQTQVATTFLRLGSWDDEPAEPTVDRYDQLDDVLSTTSTTFLGLTIGCARCHNHKFEPLTQLDYARMLAVFEPLKRPQDGRKDLDRFVGTPEELAAYRQAATEADRRVAELRGKIDALDTTVRNRLFAEGRTSLSSEAVAAFQTPENERSAEQKKLVKEFEGKLAEEIRGARADEESAARAAWKQEIEAVNTARPPEPTRAYVWYEEPGEVPETHVFVRGDPSHPADAVEPGVPAIFSNAPPERPTPTERTSGRRLWLARWLADPANPLTARVMVNRIWQHHLGEGIVATESDFGIMGDPPTHPKLLDWLASEFVRGGWRMKRLHRMIVLSSVYRMSSKWNEASAAADPATALLWRWRPRRLEAEPIRDSILAVSGRLNRRMAGPSVYPEIAPAVLAGQSRPGDGWGKSDPHEADRRSLYIFVKRSLLVPEMELMDFPDGTASCPARSVSTTAPQALTYLNGKWAETQARAFAARLEREAGADRTARIERAFELALCRRPTNEERDAVIEFLAEQEKQIRADDGSVEPAEAERRALAAFCLVLMNSNEFVYVG